MGRGRLRGPPHKELDMRVAQRMSMIGTETAFEVSARARALEAKGHDIVHLQIGEPDFDTPANVRQPANPPGGVPTRAAPEAIPELASRPDMVVLDGEIYGRILYDGEEHVSIASLPGMAERTIVLDGFSKTFAMTGWRLGYAIVPPSLVQMYGQLVINTISCAPTFAQIGAVDALRGPQDDVAAMVVAFKARRDLIVDGLNAIPGIRCLRPTRALYPVPDISGTGLTGAQLPPKLLHAARA